MDNLKDMQRILEGKRTEKQISDYLEEWYPCLYAFILRKRGKIAELNAYINKCEA